MLLCRSKLKLHFIFANWILASQDYNVQFKNVYSLWYLIKITFQSAIKLLILLKVTFKWALDEVQGNLKPKIAK